MGLKALGGLVGGFVFIRVIDDGGVESKKPMDCGPHSYPQLSGGVVRAEEACALNEQVKRKPSPPKDFHSWSRITIASDVAASFSDQQ